MLKADKMDPSSPGLVKPGYGRCDWRHWGRDYRFTTPVLAGRLKGGDLQMSVGIEIC